MGYREKERDGEQDTGIESTQEQQGDGAREKTGTESRTEKWKRKIRDGYKHREEKNTREPVREIVGKKRDGCSSGQRDGKGRKQRWAAGQRQRMTKKEGERTGQKRREKKKRER